MSDDKSLQMSLTGQCKELALLEEEKPLIEQSIQVITSPQNLQIMVDKVGDPRIDENLEDYLSRAKSTVFDMIEQTFFNQ